MLERNVARTNGHMERSMQLAASDGLYMSMMVLTARDLSCYAGATEASLRSPPDVNMRAAAQQLIQHMQG